MTNFLRRQSNFPAGLSSGGADSTFDIQPQPVDLTVRCVGTAKTVFLPAGTILLATVLYPDAYEPCTTGDWAIMDITNSATELSASAAETPLVTPYSPLEQLASRTEYQMVPTNSPDGVTHVGFRVILPKMRP